MCSQSVWCLYLSYVASAVWMWVFWPNTRIWRSLDCNRCTTTQWYCWWRSAITWHLSLHSPVAVAVWVQRPVCSSGSGSKEKKNTRNRMRFPIAVAVYDRNWWLIKLSNALAIVEVYCWPWQQHSVGSSLLARKTSPINRISIEPARHVRPYCCFECLCSSRSRWPVPASTKIDKYSLVSVATTTSVWVWMASVAWPIHRKMPISSGEHQDEWANLVPDLERGRNFRPCRSCAVMRHYCHSVGPC